MFKLYKSSDLCCLHSLQDAFDAVGYFQLALAAALEDQANPETLYVVYMKLAEIHGNHMPDAQLCQVYRERAQSLKRVLAGVESAAVGEEINADTEPGQKEEDSNSDVGCRQSLVNRNCIFGPTPEDDNCEDDSDSQICTIHVDSEGKEGHNHHLPDTESPNVEASETDTIGSHSYSESLFTESFDTAKEHISDSSTSTDTYQKPTDGKDSDLDTDHSMPSQIPANNTGDVTNQTDARDTDSDFQDEEKTPTREADCHADPSKKEADTDQTVALAVSQDNAGTEKDKSEICDTHSTHVDS